MKTFVRNHSTLLLLLLISTLALALRIHRLDFQSLWVDEIASMQVADPGWDWSGVIHKSITDQPPAYFMLLHGWLKLFGYSDYSGRMLSVVIGLAGVIAMFFLAREIRGIPLGLVAALITSLNYIHILFSQELRFYTFLFLFSTLSYLYFIRCLKAKKLSDFFFYTLFTTVALYTHYYGLVLFASQGIFFVGCLLLLPRDWRFIFLSVASGASCIILFAPWIPIIFSDIQTSSFWIQSEAFYFPIIYFYVYFKDVFACCIFALLIIYYFISLFKKWKAKEIIGIGEAALVNWGVLCFLIPVAYSIARIPMLQVRYTIIALPPLIVMISLGFFLLTERTRSILLAATCCTILLSLVFIEKYYTKMQKEDWKGMITKVIRTSSPDDLFISRYSSYCNYYFQTLDVQFRAIQPEQFDISATAPAGVWWLDGFDVRHEPSSTERDLLQKGYVLERTDTALRTKASYYKLLGR